MISSLNLDIIYFKNAIFNSVYYITDLNKKQCVEHKKCAILNFIRIAQLYSHLVGAGLLVK